MQKFRNVLFIIGIVVGSVIIGMFGSSLIVFKNTKVSVAEQLKQISNSKRTIPEIVEQEFVVSSDIPLGAVAVNSNIDIIMKPSDSKFVNKKIVINFISKNIGKFVDLHSFMRKSDIITKDINEYTLEDFIENNKDVPPYDIFYHTSYTEDNKVLSFLCCNATENSIKPDSANIFAIAIDNLEGLYGYNYITVGTERDYVNSTFKENLINVSKVENNDLYIDNNNNFILLIYENDLVVSFMTGNTLGENIIKEALIK